VLLERLSLNGERKTFNKEELLSNLFPGNKEITAKATAPR